jgi:radical SAM-linked protein
LPYAVTQGFNPKMKVAFGPALPVGTGSTCERFDLWLRAYIPAPEVLARLRMMSPPDCAPTEACYVGLRVPSLTASLTIAGYEVVIEGGAGAEDLQGSLDAVVGAGELAVEHKGKQKVFDLAHTLPKEPTARSINGRTVVGITTRMSERGSLRPEALVMAAFERSGTSGSVLSVTRTLLAEEDEVVRRL